MLVLTRKVGEELLIGNDVRIVVNGLRSGGVSLAIEAPRSIAVVRGELVRGSTKHAASGNGGGSGSGPAERDD